MAFVQMGVALDKSWKDDALIHVDNRVWLDATVR
jgi:hypothetical protein